MKQKIINVIKENILIKSKILEDQILIEKILESVEIITKCFVNNNKLFFCGNGGSAADAQHLAAEFSGRFYLDRPPLNAEALHANSSFLTAVGNDYGFENVYSRAVKAFSKENDVLVGISTSGNSTNVVKAFEAGKELGMKLIAFTGDNGGDLKKTADVLINVPSLDVPRIQETHITIGHIICEIVENNLFKSKGHEN